MKTAPIYLAKSMNNWCAINSNKIYYFQNKFEIATLWKTFVLVNELCHKYIRAFILITQTYFTQTSYFSSLTHPHDIPKLYFVPWNTKREILNNVLVILSPHFNEWGVEISSLKKMWSIINVASIKVIHLTPSLLKLWSDYLYF